MIALERIWAWPWEVNPRMGQWEADRSIAGEGEPYVPEAALTAAQAEIARLTAERDAAMAGRVKVRPLVWESFDAWTYWAASAVGTYRVQERNGVWKATIHRKDNDDLIYEYTTDGLTPNDFEAAQIAAQADYEARVLAAIQPDPTPQAREITVQEAAEVMADAINGDMTTFNKALLTVVARKDMPSVHFFAEAILAYADALRAIAAMQKGG